MSPQQPRDILLVEYDPDDAELTTIGLERNLANRLVIASDGAEAPELLIGEHATPFAFVILDLKLPKVSGQQVPRRVRRVVFGWCRCCMVRYAVERYSWRDTGS
jgi:DNA-binding response OmpR family regulator